MQGSSVLLKRSTVFLNCSSFHLLTLHSQRQKRHWSRKKKLKRNEEDSSEYFKKDINNTSTCVCTCCHGNILTRRASCENLQSSNCSLYKQGLILDSPIMCHGLLLGCCSTSMLGQIKLKTNHELDSRYHLHSSHCPRPWLQGHHVEQFFVLLCATPMTRITFTRSLLKSLQASEQTRLLTSAQDQTVSSVLEILEYSC